MGEGEGVKKVKMGSISALGSFVGSMLTYKQAFTDYAQGLGYVQSTTPGWGCSMSSTFRKIELAGFCIGEN